MSRIYKAHKTGHGMATSFYGRSVHKIKKGNGLLLSAGLGASEGQRNGNGMMTKMDVKALPSPQTLENSKPQMEKVISKLENLQIGPKRKNIRFMA